MDARLQQRRGAVWVAPVEDVSRSRGLASVYIGLQEALKLRGVREQRARSDQRRGNAGNASPAPKL